MYIGKGNTTKYKTKIYANSSWHVYAWNPPIICMDLIMSIMVICTKSVASRIVPKMEYVNKGEQMDYLRGSHRR